MPRRLADLGDLLTALRVNSIPIGPGEEAQLRQLFALQPEVDRDGLKHLLSARLIKTPAQREVFEPLFAKWCTIHQAERPDEAASDPPVAPLTSPAARPNPLKDDAPGKSKSARRAWLATLGIVLLCGLLTWWRQPEKPVIVQPPPSAPPTVSLPPKRMIPPNGLHDRPVERVWFWQATVDADNIVTPWRLGPIEIALLGLAALMAAVAIWWRYRLRRLDFAAGVVGDEAVAPRTVPGRLVLAGTGLVLLALTAFGTAGYRWVAPEPPRLIVDDTFSQHQAFLAQTIQLIEPIGGGKFEVTLGSARHTVSLSSHAGAKIPVTWAWKEASNTEQLEGNVVLNAGRLAQPIRACSEGWPKRSLVVIAAPFKGAASTAARQLAIRLLDKSSADEVMLGEQWDRALSTWLGKSQTLNRNTQVLVILPQGADVESAVGQLQGHPGPWAVVSSGDFAGLAHDITDGGRKVIEAVSVKLVVHQKQQIVYVTTSPETTKPDENSIEWVRICPGTFTMGTIKQDGDAMAQEDEIIHPSLRTVILAGFDMAATETTAAQYGETGSGPKVDVDLDQARRFCRQSSKGADLPTEAQWEYAARGGSRFPWSFGVDEALLDAYGWYGEDLPGERHDVKQKLPNPLGLYDMHGNVWEWTQDWYNDYTPGVVINPTGARFGKCKFVVNVKGECRVIRGGSRLDFPWRLRSAFRFRNGPVVQDPALGFRCVRVPPSH